MRIISKIWKKVRTSGIIVGRPREVADSNAVYYYHYDALGSVVALSDAGGDTVQTYEYSVYGQVAAEDPNHPNPYLFTGRRFDIEIGLYYYRARYYDPFTGRFLQTDPVGYGDGMNWYAYCKNNPLALVDPLGLASLSVQIPVVCITDESDVSSAYGDVDDWLYDVGFYDEYPDWYVEYVDINGAYFELHLTDGNDLTEIGDVNAPEFSIASVGGVDVVLIDGIGRLDSNLRTLKMIMGAWFEKIMAQPRWSWSIADWYQKLRNCAVTPFRGTKLNQMPDVKIWKYRGKTYGFSEVNYIGFGFGAAHFLSPMHIQRKFPGLVFRTANRYWPQAWNLVRYHHMAGADQRWFWTGYALYPGWKLQPWMEIVLF